MKRLLKKAMQYIILHTLNMHDISIEFYAYILNNYLQYNIQYIYQYNTCSIYNGNSFEQAFNRYIDIIKKLKNNIFANNLIQQKQYFWEKAKQFLYNEAIYKYKNQHILYNMKPLFLGISEPC